MTEGLGGRDWARMLMAASRALDNKRQEIDALNVFPVPDGDTGTNMSLTLKAAAVEAEKTQTQPIGQVAEAGASGALLGARGNSGVILSQLLRGLALGLKGRERADANDLAKALQQAVDLIYQAVLKPVEGTMLTVAKDIAREAGSSAKLKPPMSGFWHSLYMASEKSLARTPELLPVLKEAGVVDAGGKGLAQIFLGFYQGLGDIDGTASEPLVEAAPEYPLESAPVLSGVQPEEVGEFLYCTEFLLQGRDLPQEDIKNTLGPLGDSLLVVGESNLLKIHIHTNHPGQVLENCLLHGTLAKVAVHNMAQQAEERANKLQQDTGESAVLGNAAGSAVAVKKVAEKGLDEKAHSFSVIAVANGDGLRDILLSLGADEVITGGPTMNPSTEELLTAMDRVTGGSVILLTNEKNIVPAARQAAELSNKKVIVVPTYSIVQGIAAMSLLDRSKDIETNVKKAENALSGVITFEITRAVREAQINGLVVKTGDYLGIVDGKCQATGGSPEEVVRDLLPDIVAESELVTLYYGADVNQDEATGMSEIINELAPFCEVDVYRGGQPHYYYLIGIE